MTDSPGLQASSSAGPSLEALIRRFREAEAALHNVLNGQVDAVIDPVTAIPTLLQEAQQHLQVSEARFRRLLSRTGLVVFELEADGTTVFVNEAVGDMLGYTAAELIGRNWWNVLLPALQDDQIEALYARFQTGDVTQYELSITTAQGSTVIVELSSLNRRKSDGSLDRILGWMVDITERRNAERELIENHQYLERLSEERMAELTLANLTLRNLAEMRQRLLEIEQVALAESEHANQMKLQFLATVSHEIRSPLTTIKGFSSMLLADDASWDAKTQREFLVTIDTEADKLNNLIEQLLDESRLQAGTLKVRPEPHHLSEILGTALAQLEVMTTYHRLNIQVPPDLPLVLADPHRIAGVLVNLVGNAAKFSPPGTQITLTAAQQESTIRVDVSDEGPGIAVEQREKVFDVFWQPEQSAQDAKGLGLGLAIARGIIKAHGGEIWVADVSPGTTVSFTLPTAPL